MALVLLVSAILLVIGAFLLKRGAWPRRVGDTPHCPKCDYILSGDQRRCPECGTAVDASNVVRGDRRPRVILAGVGGALVGLGVAILLLSCAAFLYNGIDWRRHEPLSWLLKAVSNINSPAWAEVQRRLDKNLLSESDQNAVVERGIEVQNMPSTNLAAKNVLDFIGNRYVDGKLTASQADRFFANLLKVNLAVRRVVGSQSLLPYAVTGFGRGPAWWYRMRILETQIDDDAVQRNGTSTSSGGGGFGGLASTGTLAPVGKPGKHRLRCKIEMTTGIMRSVVGANWDEDASVVKRVTRDLFADFEAVEGETLIATVASPDAAGLRSLLTVRLAPNPDKNPPLKLTLQATLPVDAVFDLFIRFNGTEYGVGTVYVPKGPWGTTLYIGTNISPANFPANVDVILRSSEAAARRSIDMKRIWKGEIILSNVPVDRSSGTKQ
jgi:hypothetical protein